MEIIALILFILIIGLIGKSSSSNNNNTEFMKNNSTDSSSFDINPANGNHMIGGIGGVDTFGNPYGTDNH